MTDLRDFCRKVYQDYIADAPIPNEFKRSLRAHERVPRFIDRLASELSLTKGNHSRENVERLVQDMCRYFIMAVDAEATKRVMSPLEKIRREKIDADKQAIRDAATALEEMGETRVVQDQKGNVTEVQSVKLEDALKIVSEV